jgi:hypothetical protein
MAYSYIAKNYVGKFRVKTVIDQRTNDFCRDENGNLENGIDVYIACANGIQVFHYGGKTLEVYIPSIGRGHNIIKKIYAKYINPKNVDISVIEINREDTLIKKENITIIDEDLFSKDLRNDSNIMFDIKEDDAEVWFKVKDKNFDKIVPYIEPLTLGASISPFSSRNLPKGKKYDYTKEQIQAYEKIIRVIPKEDKLRIGQINTRFLNELLTKRLGVDSTFIKADMKKEMMKLKDYIYFKGYEKDYLNFLQKEIEKIYGN